MSRLAALALLAAACCPKWVGYDAETGARVELGAGPMPVGHQLAAHYWSPQVGAFALSEPAPGRLEGQLSWTASVSDGGVCPLARTLTGKAKGNRFEFEWSETPSPGCGAPRSGHGRAFFGLSGEQGRLFASWWPNDDDDQQEAWTAYERGGTR